MSIKLENSYFETITANQKVFNDIMNKSFPAKIGYWISRVIDKIQSESKIYFMAKQNLLKQYAELDEAGNPKADKNGNVIWSVEKGGFEMFNKEFIELQEIEIELDMDEIEADFDQLEEKGITISPLEGMLMPFLRPKSS